VISTLVELGGFGLLIVAAWMLSPILGLALAGCVLLLVGYIVGGN
jgi:phosphate/sulfate permease